MAAEIGNVLLNHLEGLKSRNGDLDIKDIGSIIEGVTEAIAAQQDEETRELYQAIQSISREINQLKKELAQSKLHKDMPGATLELDAVAKATEKAANDIMDATETIQGIAGKLSDNAAKEALSEQTTKIFNACDFQDLTGQRITKVMRVMSIIENKVAKLIEAFSEEHPDVAGATEFTDADLMNGPQLVDKAPSQDDIDKLFNS
jgi:chemotaxis protein CheZ